MIHPLHSGARLVLMLTLAWPVGNARLSHAEQPDIITEHVAYLLKRQQAYVLERVSDRRRSLLETTPLFRWDNPISGARGGVFVWTIDQRPVAITKCHVNDRKQHYVESSVALSAGLVLKHEDQTIWSPRESALEFVPVESNSSPASSSVRRLLQMRRLAAGFTVEDEWGEDSEPYQLRLMPRPLYRYASKQVGVVDGALFAFVQGTNPEALVIVEAVEQGENVRWRCGISRLTGYALHAKRDGETVYTVTKLNHPARRASYRHHWEQPRPYPIKTQALSDD